MTKLFLVRHGETLWNQEKRIQGSGSNIELSSKGKEQAESLARLLQKEKISAIYSSPLKRALETAQIIARPHDLKVETDPALREINAGELEGVSLLNLSTTLDLFLIEPGSKSEVKIPGGESLTEVAERSWKAVQNILARHKNETVVIVSHYFVISLLICQALGFPLSTLTRMRVGVGSVSILDFGQSPPCLLVLNELCHLMTSNP